MTALKEYERLESTGLWRESATAQRRDVHVSFGEASLIIRDKNDTALTHWSLPAIVRANSGQRPAIFHPGADSSEELEIDDPILIDAIEKVRKTIDRRRPRSGRLRLMIFLSFVAAVATLGVFWLPSALMRHTISVVPEAKRLAIGTSLLGHITRLSGNACHSNLGTNALARLTQRTLGNEIRRVYVIEGMARETVVLPGQLVLISQRIVEDHEAPEAAAGFLLKAADDAAQQDPLADILADAGLQVTFRLLTTGQMDDPSLARYAERLLAQEEPAIRTDALLARFEAAKISSSPFAYAKDITGESVLNLIEGDPYRGVPTPRLLSDGDWLSLQEICRPG